MIEAPFPRDLWDGPSSAGFLFMGSQLAVGGVLIELLWRVLVGGVGYGTDFEQRGSDGGGA